MLLFFYVAKLGFYLNSELIPKMIKYFVFLFLLATSAIAYGELAGGRPNAFSEGNNAFAGVVNPANTVWIPSRIDFGAFLVNQKANIDNRDNSPLYGPGKTDLTYRSRYLFTMDGALHKHVNLNVGEKSYDSSITVAFYTLPTYMKLRTKHPIPAAGTTPIRILNKTEVLSAVFSLKLNDSHSIGVSVDFLRFSHLRNGFQRSNNPLRSVSPGHVTNKGTDHSNGVGLSIGWRWKITDKLNFGAAWIKKTHCGQYRRYRGYEPHHAKNYEPQTLGGGFSYRFNPRLSCRLEALWVNSGNLPNSNNNILPDGSLNFNKRGSDKSPGPGLNDATFVNLGVGYNFNKMLSLGMGLSHRIKLNRNNKNFISHSYRRLVIYDTLAFGGNFRYLQHDVFFVLSKGFKNRFSGYMPAVLGGDHFVSEKETLSFSLSWGYKY